MHKLVRQFDHQTTGAPGCDRRRVPPHLFNFAGSPNDLPFGVNYTPLETPFYKVCLRHIGLLNRVLSLRLASQATSLLRGRQGSVRRGRRPGVPRAGKPRPLHYFRDVVESLHHHSVVPLPQGELTEGQERVAWAIRQGRLYRPLHFSGGHGNPPLRNSFRGLFCRGEHCSSA